MAYKLNKPYTEQQRIDFIVEYNHNMGLEIAECPIFMCALEAWETLVDDEIIGNKEEWEAEQFALAKKAKLEEALEKANYYQQNGVVEHKNCVFEMSNSNRKNLSDTEEALKLQGIEETTWLDKDDNYVTLTVEDIQYIRLNLILAAIQKLWIVDYPTYKEEIEACKTKEEVEAIIIDYSINVEEIQEKENEVE